MADIRKKPPCEKGCPDRSPECHAACERYAEWRRRMDTEAEARRSKTDAEQGVRELARKRKGWLRARGYKVKS
jgi:hypothetical protein